MRGCPCACRSASRELSAKWSLPPPASRTGTAGITRWGRGAERHRVRADGTPSVRSPPRLPHAEDPEAADPRVGQEPQVPGAHRDSGIVGLRGAGPRRRHVAHRDRRQGQRLAARNHRVQDAPGRGPPRHDRPGPPREAHGFQEPLGAARSTRSRTSRSAESPLGQRSTSYRTGSIWSIFTWLRCLCFPRPCRSRRCSSGGWQLCHGVRHRDDDQPRAYLHAQRLVADPAPGVLAADVAGEHLPAELASPGDAGQPGLRSVAVGDVRRQVEGRQDDPDAGHEGRRSHLPRVHMAAGRSGPRTPCLGRIWPRSSSPPARA